MEDKEKKKKGGGEMFLNYVSLCLVAQSCPTLFNPMDYNLPGSSCPWGFSRQEQWCGLPCSPPGDLPNPGIEPRSSTLQVDSLPAEPQGKPQKLSRSVVTDSNECPTQKNEGPALKKLGAMFSHLIWVKFSFYVWVTI